MSHYEPEVRKLYPCPMDNLEVVWNVGTKDEYALGVVCLSICDMINAQGDKTDDYRGVILPVIFNEADAMEAPFEAVATRYYENDGPIVRRKWLRCLGEEGQP